MIEGPKRCTRAASNFLGNLEYLMQGVWFQNFSGVVYRLYMQTSIRVGLQNPKSYHSLGVLLGKYEAPTKIFFVCLKASGPNRRRPKPFLASARLPLAAAGELNFVGLFGSCSSMRWLHLLGASCGLLL